MYNLTGGGCYSQSQSRAARTLETMCIKCVDIPQVMFRAGSITVICRHYGDMRESNWVNRCMYAFGCMDLPWIGGVENWVDQSVNEIDLVYQKPERNTIQCRGS
jgi:hypothetical protein